MLWCTAGKTTKNLSPVNGYYFFVPDCEPGLLELERVIRPGGTAFIIDNDLENGTFASWLKRSEWIPKISGAEVESWWATHGFSLARIVSEWRFNNRADLEAVIKIEFSAALADQLLAEHPGTMVDYHYCLYYRHY